MSKTTFHKGLTILSLAGVLVAGAILHQSLPDTPTHDHKTYTYKWANGLRHTTFTICGDSSVVNHQGNHWDFIPAKLKPFMKPEFEVK